MMLRIIYMMLMIAPPGEHDHASRVDAAKMSMQVRLRLLHVEPC